MFFQAPLLFVHTLARHSSLEFLFGSHSKFTRHFPDDMSAGSFLRSVAVSDLRLKHQPRSIELLF